MVPVESKKYSLNSENFDQTDIFNFASDDF